MKKILPSTLLIFLTISTCFAQLTLVHTYAGGIVYPACFSTGEKYLVADGIGQPTELSIYNLDHTLFKTIDIPFQGSSVYYAVTCLADNLFDNDSTTFEYLMNVVPSGSTVGTLKLYRDDGTLLFSRDSTFTYGTIASPAYHEYTYVIFENDNGAFLQIEHYAGDSVDLYKLPGRISYCNKCCSADNLNAVTPVNDDGKSMFLGNPVPNPVQHITTISYQLPNGYSSAYLVFYSLQGTEVKRFKLGTAFHEVQISTTDLAPGTYLYELRTDDGKSDGKKMVVVK